MSKLIRTSFKVIRKKYAKIKKGTVRLTQSSLLLEVAIDAKKDTYIFPVLTTDGGSNVGNSPFPEEIRLNQNDEFVAYEVGYYLVADKLVTTTTPVQDLVDAGRMFLSYAPDELDAVFASLEDAWLGTMQILVNKISRLEKWDLKKHNAIPRTQFQNTSAGIPQATQPSIDYSDFGTYPMQPMLTLSGAKKNDIQVALVHSIPAGLSSIWTPASNGTVKYTVSKIALVFRGMLAQNASSFQK